jgi:transposase
MLTYFDSRDIGEARGVWSEVGSWIHETGVKHLHRWWWNLESRYEQLTNYFRFRVTSALSEGVNNVIKTLKRRAYGYRNMEYFRLKIMQTCGYLNSRFIHSMKSITYT